MNVLHQIPFIYLSSHNCSYCIFYVNCVYLHVCPWFFPPIPPNITFSVQQRTGVSFQGCVQCVYLRNNKTMLNHASWYIVTQEVELSDLIPVRVLRRPGGFSRLGCWGFGPARMLSVDVGQRDHVFSFECWGTPGVALKLQWGSVETLFLIRLFLMYKLPVHEQNFGMEGFI